MEENNQKVLDPYVCENIIKEYGIQIPQTIQPSNITECLSHANVMGYPVTLKISSSHLLHKSDVGGVRLNIANDKDLEQAYNDLEKIISSNSDWSVDPTLNNNIILQKYISNGENVIVGAVNHPGFGHLILFGMGGIYTEIFHDISTRLSPINKFEAESMIKDTKIYQILSGARGQKERDIDGIIDILVKVSSLVTHFPSISQLDINPVIALNKGEGAFAVDTKIILE